MTVSQKVQLGSQSDCHKLKKAHDENNAFSIFNAWGKTQKSLVEELHMKKEKTENYTNNKKYRKNHSGNEKEK